MVSWQIAHNSLESPSTSISSSFSVPAEIVTDWPITSVLSTDTDDGV